MEERIERKRLNILRVLKAHHTPLSSQKITEQLTREGYNISERTVRFHLASLDKAGLTRYVEKQGRYITEQGCLELENARVFEKVGFLSAKIDQMTYLMDFDMEQNSGTVVMNISLIEAEMLAEASELMLRVFENGYAMGNMLALFNPGETVGNTIIPEGYVGIGTVCSITINGILLKHGIPTNSRFGGLMELINGEPSRFVGIINYDGTSLDPLEIFIKSGMTDYLGATRSGNGQIGVGFREAPAASREKILDIAEALKPEGLGAFLKIGWPGQALFGIPVSEDSIGFVVIGGLNPIAILEESGISLYSRSLSGIVDYQRLFHFKHFKEFSDKINSVRNRSET